MQYFKLIAEQECKLEQLKMQKEYEEVAAQENVYETFTDTRVRESCLSVTLSTEKHDIMTTFLGDTKLKTKLKTQMRLKLNLIKSLRMSING